MDGVPEALAYGLRASAFGIRVDVDDLPLHQQFLIPIDPDGELHAAVAQSGKAHADVQQVVEPGRGLVFQQGAYGKELAAGDVPGRVRLAQGADVFGDAEIRIGPLVSSATDTLYVHLGPNYHK